MNTLQSLTDIPQTKTSWLPTNRKSQMTWLAMLTAITLIGQYVLLGMTGLGETREVLPDWFTDFELILWASRALIEIMVVVFVGMTQTDSDKKQAVLWRFEGVLITMIMLTVGPIWIKFSLGKTIVEVITVYGVYVWGFALAGISATMLLAVAYAFKVQPNEINNVVITADQYQKILAIVEDGKKALADRGTAIVERDKALAEVDGMRQAFAFFRLLPPSALAQVVATYNNGNVDAVTLAEAFELSPSTVRGVLSRVNK